MWDNTVLNCINIIRDRPKSKSAKSRVVVLQYRKKSKFHIWLTFKFDICQVIKVGDGHYCQYISWLSLYKICEILNKNASLQIVHERELMNFSTVIKYFSYVPEGQRNFWVFVF